MQFIFRAEPVFQSLIKEECLLYFEMTVLGHGTFEPFQGESFIKIKSEL